jgi:broad specificity phosphatase PhoE
MLLLLARHGNTFEAGETATWVGARTDLPLTEKGREQAEALATALAPGQARIKRIIAGPLLRTREHAAIAASGLGQGTQVEIDGRLCEIDYGAWEGKSSEEIRAAGHEAELKAWDKRGVWPSAPGWSPHERVIAKNVADIAGSLAAGLSGEEAALIVTSNGILRFFLKLVPGAFEAMSDKCALKVATGNCCALAFESGAWSVAFWNRAPQELPALNPPPSSPRSPRA